MTRFTDPGAIVRVAVEEDRSGTAKLVLTGVNGSKVIRSKLRWTGLAAFRDGLAKDLFESVRITEELLKLDDWDKIRGAVASLSNVGSRMMQDLLDTAGDKAFWTFFSDHFPKEFYPEPTELYEAPLIEVESPDEFIPFGIIPLIGESGMIRDGDLRSLRRAMFNFLGMKGIIRHVRRQPQADEEDPTDEDARREKQPQDKLLWNRKRLPIKFFYDSNLTGARTEKRFFFDVMAEYIDADGPWPNERVNTANVHAMLASALCETGRRLNGDSREVGEPGDQVHHFSCHCQTECESVSDYSLEVRDEAIGPFNITLNKLKAALRPARWSTDTATSDEKPLLFLNACGSAAGSPKDLPAFPQTFAESHRAVIGTEAKIPDEVAAVMAERFYLLLLGGLSAGQSLHKAKWHLVDIYHNPVGALYTLHGEPGLRVSHPVSDLVDR